MEPEGPDLDMQVCGDCLYRYKHVRDFCPSCFKPYATDESMLPLLGASGLPRGARLRQAATAPHRQDGDDGR